MALTWVSCGIDYPKLAEGETDYLVYRTTRPWDHAPGSLILTEAGGYVGSLDGIPWRAGEIAAHGIIAAADRATYDVVSHSAPPTTGH
jgi:fructose-1,6-bisphosphatase/inositol monophosphatase family enzyme